MSLRSRSAPQRAPIRQWPYPLGSPGAGAGRQAGVFLLTLCPCAGLQGPIVKGSLLGNSSSYFNVESLERRGIKMTLAQPSAPTQKLTAIPGQRVSAVSLPPEMVLQGRVFHSLPWKPTCSLLHPGLTESGGRRFWSQVNLGWEHSPRF